MDLGIGSLGEGRKDWGECVMGENGVLYFLRELALNIDGAGCATLWPR